MKTDRQKRTCKRTYICIGRYLVTQKASDTIVVVYIAGCSQVLMFSPIVPISDTVNAFYRITKTCPPSVVLIQPEMI